ncbi:MAG: NIPSNAP family protein [Tannerella sp.]|jgi:hypothetical protein|nr:NIPSNAP family protein [Tannerella sp.]
MKFKTVIPLYLMLLSTLAWTGCTPSEKKESEPSGTKKQIYEWRIYTLTGDGTALDDFFKETLIPAYNRCNIPVGAFAPYKQETGEKPAQEVKEQRYLLFVYPDLQTYNAVKQTVWKDSAFLTAAAPFFETTAPNPVYSEYEAFLCEAFDKIPEMRMPDKSRTLFEYRLYHSPNDEANLRKISMFNAEEIDLFDKVGVNSVCYGEILAGTHMPALIYLTWHKDMETRNKAWETFGNHPDWQRMKNDPKYKHTATNNQIQLLSPMPYSQF